MTPRMKTNCLFIFISILMILIGVMSLIYVTKPVLITLGLISALCGFIILIETIILEIGYIKPKVYKYLHLRNKASPEDDNFTEIIRELCKKDLTQLARNWDCKRIAELFRHNAVIVEESNYLKIGNCTYHRIVGWVYASDKAEALEILNHKNWSQWDTPETENTPDDTLLEFLG